MNAVAPPPPVVDLSGRHRIHVVGAGGSGMSAIAAVLAAMGHEVSGSDAAASAALDRLGLAGVDTWVGHRPDRLGGVEMVAASTAVPPGDVEVEAARGGGAVVLRRSEVLASICALRRTVAVAGTHGKTTTSSMLALILDAAGWDPSYIIGGDLVGVGPGARWGQGEWMVVEADESDGTFVELGAEAVVVTNLEADHLEHHGDLVSLVAAFDRFVGNARGARVCGGDDPGSAALAARHGAVTFGLAPGCGYRAMRIESGRAEVAFDVEGGDRAAARVRVASPGDYSVRNALAAWAAAAAIGVGPAACVEGLARFSGVARRFERRGSRDGITFIDDYGHLPGEVSAVLAAARQGGWPRVVAVFQPHRYSRTAALWQDFAGAFDDADVVVVTGIYASGEAPREGIDGSLVADAVRAGGHPGPVHYVADLEDLPTELAGLLRRGDLCLTLGAGDLTKVVDRLVAPGSDEVGP